jgi:Amt family ammonium transporter
VNPGASVIIGLIAGVLVCISCEFVERVLKLDDVVGAISVHGTNASGASSPSDSSQTARAILPARGTVSPDRSRGCFTAMPDSWICAADWRGDAGRIRVHVQFRRQLDHRTLAWGHRVTAKVELEGLDIPEMGALGYPSSS